MRPSSGGFCVSRATVPPSCRRSAGGIPEVALGSSAAPRASARAGCVLDPSSMGSGGADPWVSVASGAVGAASLGEGSGGGVGGSLGTGPSACSAGGGWETASAGAVSTAAGGSSGCGTGGSVGCARAEPDPTIRTHSAHRRFGAAAMRLVMLRVKRDHSGDGLVVGHGLDQVCRNTKVTVDQPRITCDRSSCPAAVDPWRCSCSRFA